MNFLLLLKNKVYQMLTDNRTKSRNLWPGFLIALWPVIGAADGSWNVLGFGGDSCGSYNMALSEDPPNRGATYNGKFFSTKANVYATWVAGFISGINATLPPGSGQLVVTDFNGLAMWVDAFCKEHPDVTIWNAAGSYAKAHMPQPTPGN